MAQNRKSAGKNTNAVAAIAGIAALSYITGQAAKNRIITVDPNLPSVASQGYVMGSPDAKLELIEFGDFECPGCGQYAELAEPEIRARYVNTGKIRFRFIDFPLAGHRNTLNASNAAACAGEQNKFWEMHDLIYGTQYQWNGEATNNPDKHFKAIARQINGLDAGKFDSCVDSRSMMAKVQAHLKIATDRGIRSTPTFQIGNKQFNLTQGDAVSQVSQILDAELAAVTPAAPSTNKKP